jgi:hypothetical protein
MRFAAVAVFGFLTSLALAEEKLPPLSSSSDKIDARAELKRLGQMDGVWIGTVRPKFDPVGASRDLPDGFPIRIEMKGDYVTLSFIEKGGVLKPFPGDAGLVFAADGTALINSIAGSDVVTEVWSVSLNHVDPNRMKGFISRTVHNFGVKKDSPWRVFPVYSVVDFERGR